LVLLAATILVLRSQEILTEHVVAHPTTLFPFSPGFHYDRKNSIYKCQVEVYPCLKGCHVCTYRSRFMC